MTAEVCQHQQGWTWDYVEQQVCLHRHGAMVRQWRRSPPLQVMVQGFMGIETEDDNASYLLPGTANAAATPADEDTAIQEFARQFAAAGGLVH